MLSANLRRAGAVKAVPRCRFAAFGETLVGNPLHTVSMYFFRRTLVGVLPTHTVTSPCQRTWQGVPGGCGSRRPPPDTASSIQAPFGCPANPALVVHFGTHTNTNTHYTASSIQALFGCPANPALVAHALERLRLCCSILPVRGIWDNEHNTHYTQNTQNKNISLCCALGCGKKNPSEKYRLVLSKP